MGPEGIQGEQGEQGQQGGSPYVVFFNKNNTSGTDAYPLIIMVSPPAISVEFLPSNPSRSGFAFTGWNTKADGSGDVFTAITPVTANITLYAQWTVIPSGSFTVTFNSNNDDSGRIDANPLVKVIADGSIVGELPESPTRPGYVFYRWNVLEDGSGDVLDETFIVSANIVVYAQWIENLNVYTVTFDKNNNDAGSTNAEPASKEVPHGTAYGILPAEPSRIGYVFNGWNTEPNGSGNTFTPANIITEHVTVYAQWKEIYTVTFNKNHSDASGWTDPSPATKLVITPATTIDELPTPPTRANAYLFTGWNTSSNGSGTVFTASTTVSQDITVYAQWFKRGTGTSTDPYRIYTAEDLAYIAERVNENDENYNSLHYLLMNDIDLSEYGEGKAFNNGNGWIPIGNSIYQSYQYPFKGTFDGGNNVISGLYINRKGYSNHESVGLFGYINGGTVKNIGLENISINIFDWSCSYGGGIAGFVHSSTIVNCYTTGNFGGNGYTPWYGGGIAGYVVSSTIKNCYSTGDVSGGTVGGIAGSVNDSTIENCYSTGDVSATTDSAQYLAAAGGIAGSVDNSTIENCYSTGDVSSSQQAGGIAGEVFNSTIENCYSTGDVSSSQQAGGIAGEVFNSTIKNCIALNQSISSDYFAIGRIIGQLYGTPTLSGNFAFIGMTDPGEVKFGTIANNAYDKNGANITKAQIAADGTFGGRFTAANGWTTQNGRLPGLFGETVEMPLHLRE